MVYLQDFALPGDGAEEGFGMSIRRTCHPSYYPFGVFYNRKLPRFTFAPITIFYGGNGSGKSTILNALAENLGLRRSAIYNKSEFFTEYVRMCSAEYSRLPQGSRIITSDDVFDYLLDIRNLNENLDHKRSELLGEYTLAKYNAFQLRSMDDYERLKSKVDAQRKTQSGYVRGRLMNGIRERSNGESAITYFTEQIKENALYLLDEPENSLSAKLQVELKQFLEDSARFFGCQLVISTHSPFLLSIREAKIYDLDSEPVCDRKWTELENIRIFQEFFSEHAHEF